ncbi:CAP domain-containing protein [Endozoicomonas gorgoniicola]|uniref:CAP domain-containing protein n=1 Tax=Endozoicomonas gorgoniicola TaxID=1234144 RepID=A0ABT3MS07_9GAMM|nr:CAP domain-containing protein [Endozoicomonas gorgoniicola]MCW7551893.1 CAP domain-containing protein [Endozoicomonas gorgoniicola]
MKSAVKWLLVLLVTINSAGLIAEDDRNAEDTKAVLDILNSERKNAGIQSVYQFNKALEDASRRHCLYWSEHYDRLRQSLNTGQISWHDEQDIAGSEYYTGNMRERAKKQEYTSGVAENIHVGLESWAEAISSLMSSMGHRLNFLNPKLNDIGFYSCRIESVFPSESRRLYVFMMGNDYGRVFNEKTRELCAKEAFKNCPAGMRTCSVIFCGNGLGVLESRVSYDAASLVRQQNSGFVMYPFNGAVVDPLSSNLKHYDDDPGPLRGQMISVELLPETQKQIFGLLMMLVDIRSDEILTLVPVNRGLPANRPGINAWIPQSPLRVGGQYRMVMKYNHFSDGWQVRESEFTVQKPEGKVINISNLQQTVSVKKGEVNLLVIDWNLTPRKAINNIKTVYWESGNYVTKVVGDNVIKVQSYVDRLIIRNADNNMEISVNARD